MQVDRSYRDSLQRVLHQGHKPRPTILVTARNSLSKDRGFNHATRAWRWVWWVTRRFRWRWVGRVAGDGVAFRNSTVLEGSLAWCVMVDAGEPSSQHRTEAICS